VEDDECNIVSRDRDAYFADATVPLGVGKTTMAHIIARHAGYRPVEVNASDERTASVLKERVLRAMESSTLAITSESINQKPTLSGIISNRPNCLILDEIDGADAQSSVSTLVDIIRGEIPPKKGRATKPFLRRPIIFICNNKYAAALRPLLPYAQQFEVSPPLTERLISRLRSVLSAEGLSVNGGSSLLNQLVLATGGDIRSCLFSLQFASARAKATTNSCVVNDSKKHHQNSLVDISSVILATLDGTQSLKDDRSDVIAMLSAIFRKQSRSAEKQKAEYTYEIDRILNLVDVSIMIASCHCLCPLTNLFLPIVFR
jgi:chromosome transmission fidelity protein 18